MDQTDTPPKIRVAKSQDKDVEVKNFWTTWTIRILVGIVIFFIILAIFYFAVSPQITSVSPTSFQIQYSPFAFWGPAVQSDIPERNTCRMYQFTAVEDTTVPPVEGVSHIIPAQPTLNLDVLDSKDDLNTPSCYDNDQQLAVRAAQSCLRLQDVENGDFDGTDASGGPSVSFCFTSDGNPANPGDQQQFYSTSVTYVNDDGSTDPEACVQPPCLGSIGVLGCVYRVIDQNTGDSIMPVSNPMNGIGMRCLIENGGTVELTTCDGTNESEIFRFIRAPPNGGITQINSDRKQGTFGQTLQISDRSTGLFLNYDAPQGEDGLVLNSRSGYNWALYNRMTDRSSSVSSVQQIVYIGDLSDTDRSTLFAQKTPADIFSTIASLGLKSIQVEAVFNVGYVVKMLDYATFPSNSHTNADDNASCNLVDLTLFNTIAFGTNLVPF